jgi:predicted PurR-regulated permease PerM
VPSTRAILKVLLVAAATAAAFYLLFLVRSILYMVFIAVFLAVALGPAVDVYQRRARMPRSLAILFVYLTILAAIVGLGLLVVPPIVNGVNHFVNKVPTYVQDLRKNKTVRDYDNKYHITDKLDAEAKKLPNRLGDAASALTSITVGVFSTIFQLVTVLVLTFFFLLDGKRMVDWGLRQLDPARAERVRAMIDDVYTATGGYVIGNLIISVSAGTSTYVVLMFLDLIPLVGATIGGVGIGIVAAIANFPTAVIVWAVFFIVYQQIENNVLQPVIYRRTVSLHPLVVLIAVLIGGSQLGVLGALIAIPVAAGVQIVVRDLWRARKARIVTPPETPPRGDVAPEAP